MHSGRLATVAAVVAASLAIAPGAALAKGGSGGSGGGGGGTAPAPAPAPTPELLCPEYAGPGFTFTADGSSEFANEIPGVLCVVVDYSLSNVLTLKEVRTGTGWVSDVKSSGGGSSNRVDVEVTNTSTREKHSILVQPGKTVIR
jgi:hypothetical protein